MSNSRGLKITANIKYGITHEALVQLMAKLKTELLKIPLVQEPVLITVMNFDKETFQLIVAYNLPLPLPEDAKLIEIRRDVNLKVFEVISADAILGTPVGTS
jgi:hypothetical protein